MKGLRRAPFKELINAKARRLVSDRRGVSTHSNACDGATPQNAQLTGMRPGEQFPLSSSRNVADHKGPLSDRSALRNSS